MARNVPPKRQLLKGLIPAALIVLAVLLWQQGLFDIVEKVPAPDGSTRITVFERTVFTSDGEKHEAVTTSETGRLSGGLTDYLDATFESLTWAPDSRKYVIELSPLTGGAATMELVDYDTNTGTNLGHIVSSALPGTALADYGFVLDETETPVMDTLDVLAWSDDSTAVQFRYEFTDTSGAAHTGSFWYTLGDLALGTVPSGTVFDIVEE